MGLLRLVMKSVVYVHIDMWMHYEANLRRKISSQIFKMLKLAKICIKIENCRNSLHGIAPVGHEICCICPYQHVDALWGESEMKNFQSNFPNAKASQNMHQNQKLPEQFAWDGSGWSWNLLYMFISSSPTQAYSLPSRLCHMPSLHLYTPKYKLRQNWRGPVPGP